MEILDAKDTQVPAPHQRIDYRALAELYNKMAVGQTLKHAPVYNITVFRRNLQRRVAEGSFSVFQRSGHCFIKRLTTAEMEVV